MIRLTKQTDYALVLLAEMARRGEDGSHPARDLARSTHIPLPMVSKVLKALTRQRYLTSSRGSAGGYRLARAARDISVAEVIQNLEGPVALTECTVHSPNACAIEGNCHVSGMLRRINRVVVDALEGISLEHLARPAGPLQVPKLAAESRQQGLEAQSQRVDVGS